MVLMRLKEILWMVSIAGGFIVFTYSIKYMCKKYITGISVFDVSGILFCKKL